MIANALLFAIVILLGYGFWLLDQLKFMACYKAVFSTPQAGSRYRLTHDFQKTTVRMFSGGAYGWTAT